MVREGGGGGGGPGASVIFKVWAMVVSDGSHTDVGMWAIPAGVKQATGKKRRKKKCVTPDGHGPDDPARRGPRRGGTGGHGSGGKGALSEAYGALASGLRRTGARRARR